MKIISWIKSKCLCYSDETEKNKNQAIINLHTADFIKEWNNLIEGYVPTCKSLFKFLRTNISWCICVFVRTVPFFSHTCTHTDTMSNLEKCWHTDHKHEEKKERRKNVSLYHRNEYDHQRQLKRKKKFFDRMNTFVKWIDHRAPLIV